MDSLTSYNLGLDKEHIDSWVFHATFHVGDVSNKELFAIAKRESELGIPDSTLSYLEHDGDTGNLLIVPNNVLTGTQEQALQMMSQRYIAALGSLAARSRLITAHINTNDVVSAVYSPYIPEHLHSLAALDEATDDELTRIAEAPEAPMLDVTDVLRSLLPE